MWTSSSSGDQYPNQQPKEYSNYTPKNVSYSQSTRNTNYTAPVSRHIVQTNTSGGGIIVPILLIGVALLFAAVRGGESTEVADQPVLKTDQPVAAKKKKATAQVEIPAEDAEDYIGKYAPVAVVEMRKYGIPASITLAQGIVESQAGSSRLALVAMNHFGIKCFSQGCQPGHCMNFTDDTHKDFFRIYSSAWASYRAHSEFLSNARYAPLKEYGKDYKAWARGLKERGYATAPNYANTLISIIERYNLTQYDDN